MQFAILFVSMLVSEISLAIIDWIPNMLNVKSINPKIITQILAANKAIRLIKKNNIKFLSNLLGGILFDKLPVIIVPKTPTI